MTNREWTPKTKSNREWIRLRQAYGATRLLMDANRGPTNRKTNRRWIRLRQEPTKLQKPHWLRRDRLQIYADNLGFGYGSCESWQSQIPGDVNVGYAAKPVGDLSTTRKIGKAPRAERRNYTRLRKSASICGSDLISSDSFRVYSGRFAVNSLPSASICIP